MHLTVWEGPIKKNLNIFTDYCPSKTIVYDHKDYPWLKGLTKNIFKIKNHHNKRRLWKQSIVVTFNQISSNLTSVKKLFPKGNYNFLITLVQD